MSTTTWRGDRLDSVREEIRRIAQNAIENINQIRNVIENSPANTNTVQTPINTALNELQRRFPTGSRGRHYQRSRSSETRRSRTTSCSAGRPYPSAQNTRPRSFGRPSASNFVTKDVIVVSIGTERVPTKT